MIDGCDDVSMSYETTQPADQIQTFSHHRPEQTFCQLIVKTNPSTKRTQELQAQLHNILRILQDGDDGEILSMYQMEHSLTQDGQYTAEDVVVIQGPDKLPTTLTRMNRFFQESRPRESGGTESAYFTISRLPISSLTALTNYVKVDTD